MLISDAPTMETTEAPMTREQLEEARRQLEKQTARIESAERKSAKAERAERQAKLHAQAPAAAAEQKRLRDSWEEAVRLRDEPQKRVDAAEQQYRIFERDIRNARHAAGVCPMCAGSEFDRHNLSAKCPACGHSEQSYAVRGFVVPPGPPPGSVAEVEKQPATIGTAELCELLDVSSKTLGTMRKDGRLPAPLQITRGKVYWSRSTVEDWIRIGCPSRKPEEVAFDLVGDE